MPWALEKSRYGAGSLCTFSFHLLPTQGQPVSLAPAPSGWCLALPASEGAWWPRWMEPLKYDGLWGQVAHSGYGPGPQLLLTHSRNQGTAPLTTLRLPDD